MKIEQSVGAGGVSGTHQSPIYVPPPGIIDPKASVPIGLPGSFLPWWKDPDQGKDPNREPRTWIS